MEDVPPELNPNDCIVKYKETGDELYFLYFLHYYEPRLNSRVSSICHTYTEYQHFNDIKQTIITTMLRLVEKYDPTKNASFITYTYWHTAAAVLEYIRENCGVLVASEYYHDHLRKVMYIYNENSGAGEEDRIQAVMENTGLSRKKVLRYIQEGEMFLNPLSLNDSSLDDGEEGYIQLVERIGNVLLNPEYIVLKKMLYEAVVAAIDNLPYKENHIILDYCGLQRHEDWFVDVVEPLSKESIAARLRRRLIKHFAGL
jgi:RNA polymerase sigma factor (sigma-70 family)